MPRARYALGGKYYRGRGGIRFGPEEFIQIIGINDDLIFLDQIPSKLRESDDFQKNDQEKISLFDYLLLE